MPNGRCALHGGKSVGNTSRAKHNLYRNRMNGEEQEIYDHLKSDAGFEDLRGEIALLRIIIDRCTKAILEGDEWRVPMQALPQYVEKLLKAIERMKPMGTKLMLEDDMDKELKELLKGEQQMRDAQRGTE